MKNKEILNKTPILGKMSQEGLSDEKRIVSAKNEINQTIDLKQNLYATSCLNTEDTGRSMTEMLGTLAIAGIISVGGIAGYQYAMNQYRANQVANEMNFVRNELQLKLLNGHKQLVLGTPYDEGKTQYGEYGFAYECGDGIGATPPTDCQEEDMFTVEIENIPEEICKPLKRMVSNLSNLESIYVNDGDECETGENSITLTFVREDMIDGGEGGEGEGGEGEVQSSTCRAETTSDNEETGSPIVTATATGTVSGECETNDDCDGDTPVCGCGYFCVSCEFENWSKPVWNESTKTCEACPSGTGWDGSSCIACSADKPVSYNSHCVTCTSADSTKPVWNESTGVCEACPSGTGWDGSSCIACPADKPVSQNSRCVTCANANWSKPVWNETKQTCEACDNGKTWDGEKCDWACQANSDCNSLGSGYYCYMQGGYSCGSEFSTNSSSRYYRGTCRKATDDVQTSASTSYVTSRKDMNWWSAQRFCAALGKSPVSLSAFNCAHSFCRSGCDSTWGYCHADTTTGATSYNSGNISALVQELKTAYGSKRVWTSTEYDSCDAYGVGLDFGYVHNYNRYYYSNPALCE